MFLIRYATGLGFSFKLFFTTREKVRSCLRLNGFISPRRHHSIFQIDANNSETSVNRQINTRIRLHPFTHSMRSIV